MLNRLIEIEAIREKSKVESSLQSSRAVVDKGEEQLF